MAGLSTGWSAPALPKLLSNSSTIPTTLDEGSWLASMLSLGATASVVPSLCSVNYLGRKSLILMTAASNLACWLIAYFAETVPVLLLSRFFGGLGLGTIMLVGPMYTGEIADSRIRGTLGTLFQIMIYVGILLIFCIGPNMSLATLALICSVFPIIFFCTFIWMPESPYFLLLKNRNTEANKSLARLRGKVDPASLKGELEMIAQITKTDEHKLNLAAFTDIFSSAFNRKVLLIGLVLMNLQPLSGNLAILAYTTDIFLRSGSNLDADVCSMILAVVPLVFSVVTPMIVDRVGRRPLMMASFAVCGGALFVQGVYFYLKEVYGMDMKIVDWLPLASLIVVFAAFSLGIGPLPWTVLSEILPLQIKGVATCIIYFVFCLVDFAIIKLFQVVMDSWGTYVAFWACTAFCILGLLFVLKCIPETKGKTFQEISEELRR